ncbi:MULTISPECIES: hypothetical protein [Nocardiopsidaceae]|uniref:Secreted protein n=1 Tax=Streptomonospora nanhaiensis TaxID=1323731 RepID=A0ABY6YRE4_9ACTN|nr:hypothetical protein [Streptomonospora nanhaiensis]WAE74450.1 hypothetical protein OUQ99_04855 [Streptomonospora nanhaiensis]
MAHRGILRTATAVLALALPTALAAPAAAASADPPPQETAAAPADHGASDVHVVPGSYSVRHYYSTWREARTYRQRDTGHPTGTVLPAGRHYFFCQTEGQPHSDGDGRYSTWWVLTDDSANRDVFVSATALRLAEPWKPVAGLPGC